MDLASVLLDVGAIGSVYFLTTMLLALLHGEEGARLKAVGLGVCLVLMMLAAFLRPYPDAGPAAPPPLRYPPRIP